MVRVWVDTILQTLCIMNPSDIDDASNKLPISTILPYDHLLSLLYNVHIL